MQQEQQYPVHAGADETLTSANAPADTHSHPAATLETAESSHSPLTSQAVPDEATPDEQITVAVAAEPPQQRGGMPSPTYAAAPSGVPALPPYPTPQVNPEAATYQDLPQSPPLWQPLPGSYAYAPPVKPAFGGAGGATPSNVPWRTATSWGPTTFTITANTAAGASYLFWWVSGLLVYFGERQNRYVRFHAMQSILLTGALTVVGVIASVFSGICADAALVTGQHLYARLGQGISGLTTVTILILWLGTMIAAWTGNYLRLPIVGHYAERYAAPPHIVSSADDE